MPLDCPPVWEVVSSFVVFIVLQVYRNVNNFLKIKLKIIIKISKYQFNNKMKENILKNTQNKQTRLIIVKQEIYKMSKNKQKQ